MNKICEKCGRVFYKQKSDSLKYWGVKRFCSIKCSGTLFGKNKMRENHPNWKGGREYSRGYKILRYSTFDEASNRVVVRRIFEHREVMEEHIGRKLTTAEIVHHINGNKLDNRIENLKLYSRKQHAKFHGLGTYIRPI